MNDYSNFLAIVNSSEAVSGRWAEAVQKVVTIAQTAGVTVDETDVLDCTAARMMALGADVSADELESEVETLAPVVASRQEETELGKIAEGDPGALERLRTLPPATRITMARRAQAGVPERTEESVELSEAQKLEIVLQVESPIARLRLADKLGIGRRPLSNNKGR